MSVKIRNCTLFPAMFAALLLCAVFLSTCDTPLGFGDPVDWEAPVLVLDPGPNPRHVRMGTKLTGSVTDNVSVDRVILRDAVSGEQFDFPVTLDGGFKSKTWEIDLQFTEERNGEKIAVEIVAFDRAGNSGDASIVAISLIIDIRPPITRDIKIERTRTSNGIREAYIVPLPDLTALTTTDPRGEKRANVESYQNGWFKILAQIEENETSIESIKLNIYDVSYGAASYDPENPLLSLDIEEDSTIYSPSWFLKEEEILAAGEAIWGGYTSNYHAGQRLYYAVAVVAQDKSGNELFDDMGYFCLWYEGDFPKGVLDPNTAGSAAGLEVIEPRGGLPLPAGYDGMLKWAHQVIVTGGTTLRIEFFDDDTLDWAYAGMLTQAQWEGTANLNTGGLKMLDGAEGTDEQKLTWLMEKLTTPSTTIYNWKYDKYTGSTSEPITELIGSIPLDNIIHYVETGNSTNDHGDYVLFTFAHDKKLEPHIPANPSTPERYRGRAWPVQVVDENAPLIVFDTRAGSPEENTFPRLSDGRHFTIQGYTLRENGSGNKSVTQFRMAWIPFKMAGGPDAHIKAVQDALSSDNYPDSFSSLPGVQHWELTLPQAPDAPNETYNNLTFLRQDFNKKFDVLWGQDDKKNSYNNFTYNGDQENETKLFVFYAQDNMGHEVFRDLRLLGNRTPPNITVYDLTDRSLPVGTPDPPPYFKEGQPDGLPDLNNDVKTNNPTIDDNYYFFNSAGLIDRAGRTRYEKRRFWYQSTAFPLLSKVATDTSRPLGPNDEAATNAAYPRETIIKYWVAAQSNGDLKVDNVLMRDITFSDNLEQVGHYDDNLSLSYIEKVSEVTQRVFLFEATDSLGNTKRIQRTVAVTNAAVLSSITTATQSGSYGISANTSPPTPIILQANFSNLVRWEGSVPPLLNVRYNYHGTQAIRQIPTSTPAGENTLSLLFPLTVEENDTGVLETMYFDIADSNGYNQRGNDTDKNNRPITIPTGTRLLDANRNDAAFTPRNAPGFDWTTNKGSLQVSKTITLQGVRPRITSFVLNPPTGKTLHIDTWPGYFYKADETIEFTLTSDRPIVTGTPAPVIQFTVNGGTTVNATWARSSGNNAMVFSVLVNNTNIPANGIVSNVRLNDINSIVDSVGNAFPSSGTGSPATNITTNFTTIINIDKTPPTAPGTTLTANSTTVNVGTLPEQLYNVNPVLAIPTVANPGGETAPVTTQYSLNNGVTWVNFPTATATYTDTNATEQARIRALGWTTTASATTLNISNGQWVLVTRYTDRAGNEGAPTTQRLHVNKTFPNLVAVTAVNPNGWYRASAPLSFTLDFAEEVTVDAAANVQIVLTNRGSTPNSAGTGENNIILSAQSTTTNNNTTITFSWTVAAGSKEMRNGMYISYINLSGLKDSFGNGGPAINTNAIAYNASTTTPSPISGTFASPQINNLGINVRVDAIAPFVTAYNPLDGAVSSYPNPDNANAPDKRNTITLTFREPVIKGNGIITIQPKGDFLVPPVFEDTGYYMDCVTEATATASSNRTIWIPGFYDIYNSLSSVTHRNALTESTTEDSQRTNPNSGVPSSALDSNNPSMTRLRLDSRTGQPVGPYVKTTHGLKEGYGYSGNYSGNHGANEVFGPNTETGHTNNYTLFTAMIPDTSTKWVLRYGESITSSTAVITDIRDALKAAKFRRQEIEVSWGENVEFGTLNGNTFTKSPNNDIGSTVRITLSEPLLQGLEWTLSYPAETFTDEAGNSATAQTPDIYTFWSEGVRKPVIRVDRKSYDARNLNWHAPRTGPNDSSSFTYNEPTGDWAIGAFNNVAYRIETETPNATINYGVTGRNNSITGVGSGAYNAVSIAGTTANPLTTPTVTADANNTNNNGIAGTIWSGNIAAATGTYTATTWQAESENRNTFWVKPNLLRKFGRSGNYTVRSAQIVNGDQRRSSGWLSVLHSYNADATATILNNLSLSGTATGSYTGTVGFDALEAGKSYVVATAQRGTGTPSARGYEGVFRTLIVLNGQKGNRSYTNNTNPSDTNPTPIQNNAAGINKILVGGSNVKSGTPSIPGFPLQDGAEVGDARFVKMMYNVDNHDNGSNTGKRFYWVSTEIVCEFYFTYFGNGGNTQRTGDVNNYVMVSYGDLSYAFKLDRFPD